MRRFYLPTDALDNRTITLRGPEVRHMLTVLRLRPGTSIEFFDENGRVYEAEIEDLSPTGLTATVKHSHEEKNSSPFPITLVQSLVKGKKMDLIIQKATELGVERLITVTSKYTDKHGDQQRQHQRRQRIMLEACKQCRRNLPMEIVPVTALREVDFTPYRHKYLAFENERNRSFPLDLKRSPGPICLCIGPEGGWHPDEVQLLTELGFTAVSLGEYILRAETAAITGVSILRYLTSLEGAPSPAKQG